MRAGSGPWVGSSLTPLGDVVPPFEGSSLPLPVLGDPVPVVGVPLLELDGDVDELPPGFDVLLVPDAANATAGATVMITGTLHPALSSVRREMLKRPVDSVASLEVFVDSSSVT